MAIRETAAAAPAAALAAAALAWPAQASNQVYDFSSLLNEPHPFAGAQGTYAAAGSTGVAPVAPPPRTYGYSPPPATNAQAVRPTARQVGASDSLFGDSFDAIFRRVYLAGAAGVQFPDDIEGDSEPAPALPASVTYDSGLAASVAFGRYFGESWRGEFEASWRATDSEEATIGGVDAGDSELTVTGFMLNVYYDMRFGWSLVPYIGLGLGAAVIESDDINDGFGNAFAGKDSTEFAWQGVLGFAWELGPTFAITGDYRYFGTADDDVSAHAFLAGLRLSL